MNAETDAQVVDAVPTRFGIMSDIYAEQISALRDVALFMTHRNAAKLREHHSSGLTFTRLTMPTPINKSPANAKKIARPMTDSLRRERDGSVGSYQIVWTSP